MHDDKASMQNYCENKVREHASALVLAPTSYAKVGYNKDYDAQPGTLPMGLKQ